MGGPFYLAYKQIWLHAVIAAVLSLISAGLSWLLLYPLIIKWVIRSHYTKLGWKEITEGQAVVRSPFGAHSSDVRILSTPPDGDYRALGEVAVKLTRRTPVERKYSREDADQRLRERPWLWARMPSSMSGTSKRVTTSSTPGTSRVGHGSH